MYIEIKLNRSLLNVEIVCVQWVVPFDNEAFKTEMEVKFSGKHKLVLWAGFVKQNATQEERG